MAGIDPAYYDQLLQYLMANPEFAQSARQGQPLQQRVAQQYGGTPWQQALANRPVGRWGMQSQARRMARGSNPYWADLAQQIMGGAGGGGMTPMPPDMGGGPRGNVGGGGFGGGGGLGGGLPANPYRRQMRDRLGGAMDERRMLRGR